MAHPELERAVSAQWRAQLRETPRAGRVPFVWFAAVPLCMDIDTVEYREAYSRVLE